MDRMKVRRLLLLVLTVLPGLLWASHQLATGLIWWLGCAIGWSLVHVGFSFTSAFGDTLTRRRPQAFAPIAALLVVLIGSSALLTLVGPALGRPIRFPAAPLSTTLVAGAFLFGVGMQLARRCGSGTLAAAAKPDLPFALSLIGLVVGSFLGSLHRPALERVDQLTMPPVDLLQVLPLWAALAVQLTILAAVLLLLLQGPPPWAAWRASMILALPLVLVVLVSGEPFKVLWGFVLTGAHAAVAFGWDPESSAFWSASGPLAQLRAPGGWLLHDAVVADLGVLAGAFATGWWSPQPVLRPGSRRGAAWRAATGSLLMGYGGFLAYGCNISSFVGGVMGFSLHGWLWLAAALAGSSVVSLAVRPKAAIVAAQSESMGDCRKEKSPTRSAGLIE